MAENEERYEYNGAICSNVKIPDIGSARAVYYDLAVLDHCINYCKHILLCRPPVFYILAGRIDPFIVYYSHSVDGTTPSLLEALVSIKLNLLVDVGFNREAGEEADLYWN